MTQLSLKISKTALQSDKKKKENSQIHNHFYTTDVINDNSSSQPIAASESGLAAQSAS